MAQEIHIPIKTSRDTIVTIRARTLQALYDGVREFAAREIAKGETITLANRKTPVDLAFIGAEMEADPATVKTGYWKTATLRIRRA